MSDLSNLLGALYGDSSPDDPPVAREAAAVERSTEWSPASRPDPAQSDDVNDGAGDTSEHGDDLAAALSAALAHQAPPMRSVSEAALPAAAAAVGSVAVSADWTTASPKASTAAPADDALHAAPMWAPGDDDIFPAPKPPKATKKGLKR